MIKAVIFDLDGTLVQTEKLKALSYAKAAVQLCPNNLEEKEVIEAFKDVVGLSRREVASRLIERFGLEPKAKEYTAKLGVSAPWQAYVQIRLNIYNEMLAEPRTLLDNQWPHNVSLLKAARERGCQTALATMSHCQQVQRVLEILELKTYFDFVATRDDVNHGKPNPEIYQLVLNELGQTPEVSLIIEDSPAGVEAALNVGAEVVAVSTPFTRERLHAMEELPTNRIVDNPNELMGVVGQVFKESISI